MKKAEKKRKAEAKAVEQARERAVKAAERRRCQQERGAFADQEVSQIISDKAVTYEFSKSPDRNEPSFASADISHD